MDYFIPDDLPSSPNWALACPPGEERPACDLTAPIYDATPQELAARALDLWLAEPRTALLDGAPEAGRLALEQRSALFKFQDIIIAEFIGLDEGRASFTLYSYSVTGYWDLGVNRRRVDRWIELLGAPAR
jgi:uncharacterized protein (DUF1499 family)